MTAEFYKKVDQNTYLPNEFRRRILGNKKVLEKSQTGWRQMLVSNLPFRSNVLVITVKKLHSSTFQNVLVLSNLA